MLLKKSMCLFNGSTTTVPRRVIDADTATEVTTHSSSSTSVHIISHNNYIIYLYTCVFLNIGFYIVFNNNISPSRSINIFLLSIPLAVLEF